MTNKLTDKVKGNWNKTLQDPYVSAKFNYKVTKVFTYFIMAIISLVFVRLIYNQFKTFSAYSLLIGAFMIGILIYMMFTIYTKVLLPQRKIIEHYDNVPTPLASHSVNVREEIDDILNQFDKDGNKKK